MNGLMNYNALMMAANKVIAAIDAAALEHASVNVFTSIKNQMLFIRDNAAAGKNPLTVLPPNTKFTYAVLASRELASPDELMLQAQIDKVTEILVSA